MKKKLLNIFLVLIFLAGLSLLLYPTFSEYWNSFHSSRAITDYQSAVADLNEEVYEELLQSAREYNVEMLNRSNPYAVSDEELERYRRELNVTGTGVMGVINIPVIDVSLPVYHGTAESVLNTAIGHLEWSSLPVGGESTHAILSGHRGLPSAKLFTNLDKVVVGDIFTFEILNEVLTYEVDQIRVVEPHEVETLGVEPGKDLCTLVTCTPYGINTHRLLVQGHRIDNIEEYEVRVISDASRVEPLVVIFAVGIPLAILLMLVVLLKPRKKQKKA